MITYGYGNMIMSDIETKFKKNKILEIVLLSLKSSFSFYNKLGCYTSISKNV